MPFDPDDARLTAYALGELDPADRASVEAVLRDDPEAESFVAGVREVVALLADELRLESMVGLELDPERRRAIEDRLAASVPQTKTLEFKQAPPRSTSRFRPHWLPVAAAAGLIGFAAGMFATFPRFATDQQRPSLAFNEAAGRPMMGAEPTARRDGFAAPPQGSEAPSGPAYASAPLPPPPAADVSTPPPAGSKFVRSAPAPAPAAPAKPADAAPLRVFARGGLSSRGSAPLGVEAAAGRNDPPAPAAMANNAPSGRGPRIGSSQQAGNNAMQAAAPAGGEAQGPDKLAGVERVGPGSPLSMRGMRMMPSPVAPAPIDPAADRPGINDRRTAKARANAPSGQDAKKLNQAGVEKMAGGAVALKQEANELQAKDKVKAKSGELAAMGGPNDAAAKNEVKPDAANDQVAALNNERVAAPAADFGLPIGGVDDLAALRARVERERFARANDHPFVAVVPGNEVSSFSVDADDAAYGVVRRSLAAGVLPPPEAVRIEELLNAFTYDDPAPKAGDPLAVRAEVAACPWNPANRLARIGLKARGVDPAKRPPANLVFLVEVSGSMEATNKLPLLKAGMKRWVETLGPTDRVGIITYGGATSVVHLPSTPGADKAAILAKIDALKVEGVGNGGPGMELAYSTAAYHVIRGGVNRVVLATDGNLDLGGSRDELLTRAAKRAGDGVFLSVLDLGVKPGEDDYFRRLADRGGGRYAMIHSVDEVAMTLARETVTPRVSMARDVKVRVEFNPDRVASYRLIGYEDRTLDAPEFRNEATPANPGDLDPGRSITALYEIVPTPPLLAANNNSLKYGRRVAGPGVPGASPETMTITVRSQSPQDAAASEVETTAVDDGRDVAHASTDLRFAAAVAGFGMLLRDSPYKGSLTWEMVRGLAEGAVGPDPRGERRSFLGVVGQAERAVDAPAVGR